MSTRAQMWASLPAQVDLLVIGGGITGAGVARDAVRRGLSVALVEMRDLAFGTSSRSSKLVHGGLRYLEQYEFSLVFEAVSERRILMDIAPHLVNPLGFLFPVFESSSRPLWFINAGMWLYDGMSLFRSPKLHQTLKPSEVGSQEPALTTEGLTGAPLYYDCATDDARLTLENAVDAARWGATIATWAKVVSLPTDPQGRVVGAVVKDQLGGETKEIRARTIVNATGPWTDRTLAMSDQAPSGPLLRPTKGVHLVVERAKLPVENAVVALHPADQRVLFAIPWGEHTYVGTTDTDYDGDPADVSASSDDVAYLIDAARAYFPHHPLTPDDVISTWAGLRPLMAPPQADGSIQASSVSREHQIVVGRDGLVTIAGGKLTTYRRMAAEVVDTAVKLLRLGDRLPRKLEPANTDHEPLPGAIGWPDDDDHDAVAEQIRMTSAQRLTQRQARLLGDTYGMLGLEIARRVAENPDLAQPLTEDRPEILAQVDWAVEHELAATVADVMVRRTQLFYRDVHQGLLAARVVARRMRALLDWSETREAEELASYEQIVARSRQWRR